jgi:hypothetical protein
MVRSVGLLDYLPVKTVVDLPGSVIAPVHVAFRALQGRRRPDCIFSELNTHPAYPLSTLRCVPRGSSARLEAERIATPFS